MLSEKIEEKKKILREFIDQVKEGGFSKEDVEKRDAAFAELLELEKTAKIEAELDKREDESNREYREAKITTPASEDKSVDEYRDAFATYLKTGELRTVTDYQNKGVVADGGYLAPADFYNAIVEKRNNSSIVRQVATVISIDRDTNIPVEGADATAAWVAEGGTITGTKQAFSTAPLTLRKLVSKIGVTEEMLSDSKLDLIPYLAGKLARIFVEKEETAFVKGTAANNQPVGILSSGITTTRTAAATAVSQADVVGLYEALNPNYRNNAVWIVGTAMEAAMMMMTTAGGYPLWQQSYQVGVPNTFLGKPVFVSNDLDDTIAAGKFQAIFGDLAYYYIGDKGVVSLTRFDHRDVDGRFDFLASERVAGVLTNNDAVKILQCKAS